MTVHSSSVSGKWVNPSVLQWARKQAAYEPEDVAKSLNVALDTVRNWEEGLQPPDIDTIRRLSLLYDLPFSYFFLKVPPEETPLKDYRGVPQEKRARLSRETHLALREFRSLTRLAWTLQEITGTLVSMKMGEAYPNEYPEEVARRETERFGVTREVGKTYDSRRAAIENLGIFVFSLDMPSNECRGAAIREKPNATAILVNQKDPETARSFTLLHEYYHLLLRNGRELMVCDQYPGDTESFANRFAASVLVPEDEFREVLREMGLNLYHDSWTDTTLAVIAKHFAVSRDVIAIRLENLRLAPPGFYIRKRELWDKVSKAGGGFNREGKSKMAYAEDKLGHRFFDLALQAVKKGVIHPIDAAVYMGEVRHGKNPWVVKASDIKKWTQ